MPRLSPKDNKKSLIIGSEIFYVKKFNSLEKLKCKIIKYIKFYNEKKLKCLAPSKFRNQASYRV